MRTTERVTVYAALATSLLMALAMIGGGRTGALTSSATAAEKNADPRRLIAVVDIVGVVERMMDSDKYKPARDEAGAAAESEIKPMRDRLQSLEERLRGLPQGDPAFNDVGREYQQLRAELERKAQGLGRDMDQLTMRQLIECYRLARASADAVAEQMGFAYVIASRPVDKDLEAPDTASAVRQLVARPMLRFPEGTDITPDVKQDLKLN